MLVFAATVLIFFVAGLLYLLCLKHVDNLGAYSIPSETGLLIPSVRASTRNRGAIPSVLNNATWWNSLVMAHAIWCLLILSIVLLYKIWLETVSSGHAERKITSRIVSDTNPETVAML